MKVFRLDGEEEEATVTLDKNNGKFEFSGRFLPQNAKEFFAPIFDWINDYVVNPNNKTVLTFKMDYFNTASSKKILDMLSIFEQIHGGQTDVEVHWYSYETDTDILEAGKGYSELVNLPFIYKTY